MAEKRTRLTVDLPVELVKKADEWVQRGVSRSRNHLILQAVEAYIQQVEQQWIDTQFAEMECDEQYQKLALEIAQEFEQADWEALHAPTSDEK